MYPDRFPVLQQYAPKLNAVLNGDLDPWTRCSLIMALGETQDPSVVPVLIHCLKDPEEMVREEAAGTLGYPLHAREAIGPIMEALAKEKDNTVIYNMMIALRNLKAMKAVSLIITFLEAKDEDIRAVAAESLGMLHAKEALPALRKALKYEKEEIAINAMETAIEKIVTQNKAYRRITDKRKFVILKIQG